MQFCFIKIIDTYLKFRDKQIFFKTVNKDFHISHPLPLFGSRCYTRFRLWTLKSINSPRRRRTRLYNSRDNPVLFCACSRYMLSARWRFVSRERAEIRVRKFHFSPRRVLSLSLALCFCVHLPSFISCTISRPLFLLPFEVSFWCRRTGQCPREIIFSLFLLLALSLPSSLSLSLSGKLLSNIPGGIWHRYWTLLCFCCAAL